MSLGVTQTFSLQQTPQEKAVRRRQDLEKLLLRKGSEVSRGWGATERGRDASDGSGDGGHKGSFWGPRAAIRALPLNLKGHILFWQHGTGSDHEPCPPVNSSECWRKCNKQTFLHS